jgi:hypothetical protein
LKWAGSATLWCSGSSSIKEAYLMWLALQVLSALFGVFGFFVLKDETAGPVASIGIIGFIVFGTIAAFADPGGGYGGSGYWDGRR